MDQAKQAKPPLLTFYGDDFTGSTDVLEALALAGAPAMLFLESPSPETLANYPDLAAVGVAGTSRSRSPEWMDKSLPEVFSALFKLGAPLCHYKTCSTFDSSPEIGSIGHAADIGREIFGTPVLCIVGVPRLRRFVVFSNLFAAGRVSGADEIFRIDRHPTMSQHPTTPMHEADLRLHLAAQSTGRVAGFDFTQMSKPDAFDRLQVVCATNDIVVLDTFDEASMAEAGQLLYRSSAFQPRFVIGSSGVEYAYTKALADAGELPLTPPPPPASPTDRILVACGSCSPITEAQISWAEANGFHIIAIDTASIANGGEKHEIASVVDQISSAFSDHAGVIIHTARGPNDPRLALTRQALAMHDYKDSASSNILGSALGSIMHDAVAQTQLKRIVLAGGDSSSHAAVAMGVTGLGVAASLVPGAPLCSIHSQDPAIDSVEICLKGGQVGGAEYFAQVMTGHM